MLNLISWLPQKKLIFPGFANSEFSSMDIRQDLSSRVIIILASLPLARLILLWISSMWAERLRQLELKVADLRCSLVSGGTWTAVVALSLELTGKLLSLRKLLWASGYELVAQPQGIRNFWVRAQTQPRLTEWPQACYRTFACPLFSSYEMGKNNISSFKLFTHSS